MKIKKNYIGFYLQTTMEAIIKKIQKKVKQQQKKEGGYLPDIVHNVIEKFITSLTIKETEKIVYKYGFTKALDKYIKACGCSLLEEKDSDDRLKEILWIVLIESHIIE
jgi:hypothetical protein